MDQGYRKIYSSHICKVSHSTRIQRYYGLAGQSRVSLTVYSGVGSSIQAQSHTFMEIDLEIVSMVIPHVSLIQEGLLSVTSESMCTKY